MADISTVTLSYLKTLSHEELIGLIRSFAMVHEDIRLYLEEKSTAVIVKREVSAAADAFTPSHPLVNRSSAAK